MSSSYWTLILLLAVAAFTIRVLGLVAGDAIRTSRYAWVLDDLPGLIIVALVGSSLAGEPPSTWFAAAVALLVAHTTKNVFLTMCGGVIAFAGLAWILV
jgi:branched-subunit amino acid transport protein